MSAQKLIDTILAYKPDDHCAIGDFASGGDSDDLDIADLRALIAQRGALLAFYSKVMELEADVDRWIARHATRTGDKWNYGNWAREKSAVQSLLDIEAIQKAENE